MNNENISIFYADDDTDDQEMFIKAARYISESLQVTILNNGVELMLRLNDVSSYPQVILLDLNMPLKNGFEVLKEIRASYLFKHLPVVIFSTSNDTTSIESSRMLGADMYITKPSSLDSLTNIVKFIIETDWQTFSNSAENFVYNADHNASTIGLKYVASGEEKACSFLKSLKFYSVTQHELLKSQSLLSKIVSPGVTYHQYHSCLVMMKNVLAYYEQYILSGLLTSCLHLSREKRLLL